MAQNIVEVTGMFGEGKVYFSNSPVIINITGLRWPQSSPFTIVHVEVVFDGEVVGSYRSDAIGQSDISFDISSALRVIWRNYTFAREVAAAANAVQSSSASGFIPADDDDIENGIRTYRSYYLRIYTEYFAADDGGVFTKTQCIDKDGNTDIPGGQCLTGGLTEWERSFIEEKENAHVAHWEHTNLRNGDASTKPVSTPERVGKNSITSWVDVNSQGTQCIFYSPYAGEGSGTGDSTSPHPPLVLRDNIPYVDFLFVNRRGAVETCSAQMLEDMGLSSEVTQYRRNERPAFRPTRSLLAINSGSIRSWNMSSGYQTRDWAVWWVTEFISAKQWWMLYQNKFIPVVVEPAKKDIEIYDRTKQNLPSVGFTVTLALKE